MNIAHVQGQDEISPGEACAQRAKWAGLVDDDPIPMPQRSVAVSVIKAQAQISAEFVLVRDHNSAEDVVLRDDETIDLAEGNVFYRLPACEVQLRGSCRAAPKRAFFVDDRAEVTTRPNQTGRTLRDLFTLASNAHLVRDTEGPNDREIGSDDEAAFEDGPVFYTRTVPTKLRITVNARVFTEHDGVTAEMNGRAIASLVYPENPGDTRASVVSDGNREIGSNEIVCIHGCEVFEVARKSVTGGYDLTRIERELEQLRLGGVRATLITEPIGAVIYHDLKTSPGDSATRTDVLVPVPQAYPGQFIDWAYLPENSPLVGRVKGSPQDDRITSLGVVWRKISYHPHSGGGGPAWNPGQHGFHTYLGELVSWLRSL